jgi:FMN phosphatase YigB (HAD superfamily)
MKKGIVLSDLDDTLLSSTDFGLKIGKRRKGDEEWDWLTSDQLAKDADYGVNQDYEWDFSDFEDYDITRQSIEKAKPIIANLKLIDIYARMGYDIAFLTARSNEDGVRDGLRTFLKVYDKDNRLVPATISDRSRAVWDPRYSDVWDGLETWDRKAEVIKAASLDYRQVVFIDDDIKNVRSVKALGIPNVKVIDAKRMERKMNETKLSRIFESVIRESNFNDDEYEATVEAIAMAFMNGVDKDGFARDFRRYFGSEVDDWATEFDDLYEGAGNFRGADGKVMDILHNWMEDIPEVESLEREYGESHDMPINGYAIKDALKEFVGELVAR